MRKLKVWNQEGKIIGEIELNPKIFDGKVNQALIHQAVVTYLANLVAFSVIKGDFITS